MRSTMDFMALLVDILRYESLVFLETCPSASRSHFCTMNSSYPFLKPMKASLISGKTVGGLGLCLIQRKQSCILYSDFVISAFSYSVWKGCTSTFCISSSKVIEFVWDSQGFGVGTKRPSSVHDLSARTALLKKAFFPAACDLEERKAYHVRLLLLPEFMPLVMKYRKLAHEHGDNLPSQTTHNLACCAWTIDTPQSPEDSKGAS
jgi:hypothetical protein